MRLVAEEECQIDDEPFSPKRMLFMLLLTASLSCRLGFAQLGFRL
jgi:hypothetical protein